MSHRRSLIGLVGVVLGALLITGSARAEAPLEEKLGLDMDQAKAVATIEAKHRSEFRTVRGQLIQLLRSQRAARLANDRAAMEALEVDIRPLRSELRAIRMREYAAIEQVLTAEQRASYAKLLEYRHSPKGRSKDDALWLE